jgi:hypothetical protein
MPRDLTENSFALRIRRSFWALSVVLGFLQAWASRMTLVSDTVSYLDIGDCIWHRHWSAAVNGLWSPLFSTVLGMALGLFRPSPYWEYPLVHFIMFAIFLFTLWGFDFFSRELILLRRQSESGEEFSTPAWVWLTIGYTLFLWSSLRLIEVSETNPDMLVAAFFYFACGFLVKLRRQTGGWPTYLSFGLVLGFGYLTKSIMFPVSLVCLVMASVVGRRQPWRVIGAWAVFFAVSGTFIVALSLNKGRVTFGESGRYNYAVHVNQVPRTHWQGEMPGAGKPLHSTRQIFDHPATFEFATPLGGTYPAWTDPSYWYEGVQTHFDLRRALGTEVRLLGVESHFLFELDGSMIAALFVMFYVGARRWSGLKDVATYWFLLVPAVITLAMYAMIHIESRYLAPFLVVFLFCLFLSAHLPASQESRRLCSAVAVFLFAMFICPIESSSMHVKEFARDILRESRPDPNSYQAMSSEMYRLGLRPGDRIASLDYSLYGMSSWARLSRVSIVAEVYYWPDLSESAANSFWSADTATQEKVIHAIAETGARVVISQQTPSPVNAPGWHRVGNTQYYAFWLSPSSKTDPVIARADSTAESRQVSTTQLLWKSKAAAR